MKIAAIYDIHGNLPALDAVLAEIEQTHADLILVGGDIISGPLPAETLERLQSLGERVRCIRGNGDREVVAAFDGLPFGPTMHEEVREITAWVARQLTRQQRDFLAQLPEQLTFEVDGLGDVLFCHASPRNDEEIFTMLSPEARMREILAGVKQPVVVCGHTHMQFQRRIGDIELVNAGSVGMSYDGQGAYWLLLGPTIELRHTPYDLEQAAATVRASGYPQAEDFAANNVLKPPTAAEALAVFEPKA